MSRNPTETSQSAVLIVDPDRASRGLVAQMLRGFGIAEPQSVQDGAEAQAFLADNAVDLCVCEATLPDMGSSDLIQWIRHHAPEETRTVPVIVLTAHTPLRVVTEARDSGASVVVKKPLSARVLREHLDWAAKESRPFVRGGNYFGPDRRFRSKPVPPQDDRRGGQDGSGSDGGDDANAIVRAEIGEIEAILAGCRDAPGALTRKRLLEHGLCIATYAGRAGYAHLEIAARGFCDAASGADFDDADSRGAILVHVQALQLLTAGQDGLTPRGADRILDELTRMLQHLGLHGRASRDTDTLFPDD